MPPSEVEYLNDRNFEDAVGKDKDVFVAFTAPWCGRMSIPTWPVPGIDTSADMEQTAKPSLQYGNN